MQTFFRITWFEILKEKKMEASQTSLLTSLSIMLPEPQPSTSGISKAKQLQIREEAPSPLASPLSSPIRPLHILQDYIIICSHTSA
jgi:hypothetical protein